MRLCGVGRGEGGMQQVSLCRGERERVGMQQGETVREGVGRGRVQGRECD